MEYKAPSKPLDFMQDWSSWLSTGDTIATSTWTVETGLTVDSETNTTTTATVIISGGVAGTTYKITNSIVSANALETDRVWFLRVQEQII